jgi:aldose 1-epimerase
MKRILILTPIVFALTVSCKQSHKMNNTFYLIRNRNGMEIIFTGFGARLVSLFVLDKNGKPINVVMGFNCIADYDQSTEPYFGATIGRYANRIARGKFSLNGTSYHLSINNAQNTLHGGINGFQYKLWKAVQPNKQTLVFTYLSKDGEEGFPGNLQVKVTYRITDNNELKMQYEAISDKPTVVNLTNYSFFNLNGEGSGTIENHLLQINANTYTPVDSTLIPTGKIEEVMFTPFDFTVAKNIGRNINRPNEQLNYCNGYDHNLVLNGVGMKPAAFVIGDKSGIMMEVFTDEPGLQFYSGNFMKGENKMRKGIDEFRTAFCLEPQHFPDSPNHKNFPSTVLNPGKFYYTVSVYKFSALKGNKQIEPTKQKNKI